jgi:hypothetical protein
MTTTKTMIASLGGSLILAFSSLASGSIVLAKGHSENQNNGKSSMAPGHNDTRPNQPQSQSEQPAQTNTVTPTQNTPVFTPQNSSENSDETNGNSNAHNKITICHATGSATNPYVMISPNANGVISGHVGHQDGRDIIPPFDYNDHGTIKHFAGQNWDTNGQATFNNGCKPVGGGGGGPQKDCDNDFDNSPASECQTPTTPPTGGGGGVTTTPPQVLGVSTTAGGAGAASTPIELPNTGVADVSSLWASLTIISFALGSLYWRERVSPLLRRK